MWDIVAFLIILALLFGIPKMREMVFGTLGFIFWIIIIFVGVVLIADAFTDKRTPEQKQKDKEKEEREKAIAKANREPLTWHDWLAIILVLAFLASPLLLLVIK